MGWDGAGGYVRQHNFSADASAGINILAARMDAEIDDVASAMTLAWTRNGQNVPTTDMPMGGRKFVNVGAPTSVSNFMRVREFIENVPIFMQDTEASADRISVSSQYFTSVSANQAPVDGTKIIVRVKSDKSSAVLYLDGHSANVEFQDGTRAAEAMVSGGIYELTYSSADTAWRLPRTDDGRTAAERAAGVTPENYRYPEGHVYRYGTNTTPGTTDMATAINNAVLVMAQHEDGGEVKFPAANCRIASTINGAINVSLVGHGGMASTITADNCDGITLGFNSGFGNTIIRGLNLQGNNGSTHYGIKVPGSLNDADELYGITIEQNLIRGFNVGIHSRTGRNVVIQGNWIQDVDRGLELIGKNLVVHAAFNRIVKAAGAGGAGDSKGIVIDSFNYTSGAGVVPCEGLQFVGNYVYGFDTAYYIGFVNVCNIIASDIQAAVYGIDFATAQYEFNIIGCHFDLSGTGVLAGIYGRGLASVLTNSKPRIIGCSFSATGTSTSVGVKINDSGNQNQSYVTVDGCEFDGFTDGDILFNNACGGWIINNRCTSSTPASSISIPTVVTGPVFVNGNICTKLISYTASEAAAGELVIGPNIYSGTSKLNFPGYWATPSFSAGDFTANGSMTWTVASGEVVAYEYVILGNMMTVNFSIETSTVGGTPNTTLRIAIPASKTATKEAYNPILLIDNGSRTTGTAHVGAGGTVINIQRTDAANFTAATDATYVKGQITFEID